MPETIAGPPAWLERSHNFKHLTTVLSTLAKRERDRRAARSTSQHPSKRHRVAHIASTVQANPEHVAYYSVAAGSDPDNTPFNRYADILPYDRTRVIVCPGYHEDSTCGSTCQQGRYLNADWVRELAGGKWWIAMQAPLPQTVHTFLSSLLEGVSPPPDPSPPSAAASPQTANLRRERRIRTVVQLTKDLESGMRKAHAYFPPIVGQSWVAEPGSAGGAPIEVTLLRTQTIDAAHCVQSIVRLQPLSSKPSSPRTHVGEPVLFQHLLYASWPDHGVPAGEDRAALLHFAKLVDEANRDLSLYADTGVAAAGLDPDPPIVAGCSAGVGRTGTFIALCSLLRHYGFLSPSKTRTDGIETQTPLPESPLGPLPEELQGDMIAKEIDALREQRPYMVERDDQALMLYEALVASFASASDANAKDGA
ncbi:phosphatases II [Ganoderma leucocontextum]|nr:phosphatases II [Ganoderma leucocontextum]